MDAAGECMPPTSTTAPQIAESLATTLPSTQLRDCYLTSITEDYETICWGCGLRLILPSNAPIFKCGWCGAITNQNALRHESKTFRWRHLRDRCFVCVLLIFMMFVICGGVWAVYPAVFSVSLFCGVFHSILTVILSVATISMFILAAFRNAGNPPAIVWGAYPAVGKDDLENYTFCQYCLKPKSPRTHHCRSCGTCVLDMDHHCPFIGNCVGAANHRCFVNFLIMAITSMVYVTVMSAYAGCHVLPALGYRTPDWAHGFKYKIGLLGIFQEAVITFLSSALLISSRGLVLIYLFVASLSVEIGLCVLLWQQLCFIYEGKTYLGHLSSKGEDCVEERDCRNLYRFFGFPSSALRYLPNFSSSNKIHRK
ncbi:hypothetical protein Nepgr_012751 [Nepenthes gracilis]|uniref:S-acyltransferase n=1 Tax=Nepenthes gracilis TaxID=150966 RepID=A0AAD3SGB6_NEPGR|nr:hypothetical protein Nepgr_012751 [Nepenthes gracilis]